MSLESALASIGNNLIANKLVNNWQDKSPTFKRLKAKGKITSGGNMLQYPIAYTTNGTVTWYTGTQDIPATENQELTCVKYNWKQLGGQLVYTGTDLLKNSGPTAIVSLVTSKKDNLINTVQDTFATAIFNVGTTSTQLDGFRLMCTSTGQYPYETGGIDPTDFSGWAGNLDSSTGTLTRKSIQDLILDCSPSNDDRPTVLIMNASVFGKLKSLLTPQERYVPAETMKIGYVNLQFDGIDVIVDGKCPGSGGGTADNHIFAINENYIQMHFHSKENFKFDPVLKPINQNAYAQKLLVAASLGTDRRDRHGLMTVINSAS